MQPSYLQIADLFGFSTPQLDNQSLTTHRRPKGSNAQESAELGSISLREGDFHKAIEHFRRAIEQSEGQDPGLKLELGGAYEFADMEPQALRQYRAALRVRKDTPEPHLGIAELYKRDGRRRQAVAELQAALEENPGSPYLQFKLAELHRDLGQRDLALVAIQHVLVSSPSDPFYHYWMGDLLIELKEYDRALDAFRAAIELSPGDDFLYQRASIAFWLGGKRHEAVKAIRLASDLDPDKHVYHGILELLLSELGLEEEADLEAERSSQMDRYDQDLLQRFAKEVNLVA